MSSSEKYVQKRRAPAWLTLSAFALGALWLVWLPVEETDEKRALAFAAALNAWLVIRYLNRLSPANRKSLLRHILAGALAGLAITPVALFLIAFKTGMHGHGTPDFTAEQILSVINRTHIWSSAGLLLGLLSGFLFKTTSQ